MWEFIYVGIREQYYHFFTSPPLPSTPGAEQFLHFSKVKTPLFLHFSKVKPYIFLHFSKISLREKIGRISDSTAITIQKTDGYGGIIDYKSAITMLKKVVMAVLSLHNSLLCYLCSGKVRYATT